jgi:hypothetical protein
MNEWIKIAQINSSKSSPDWKSFSFKTLWCNGHTLGASKLRAG